MAELVRDYSRNKENLTEHGRLASHALINLMEAKSGYSNNEVKKAGGLENWNKQMRFNEDRELLEAARIEFEFYKENIDLVFSCLLRCGGLEMANTHIELVCRHLMACGYKKELEPIIERSIQLGKNHLALAF